MTVFFTEWSAFVPWYKRFFSFYQQSWTAWSAVVQKCRKNFFQKKNRTFCFERSEGSLLKYKFFKPKPRKFHFAKYKNFFHSGFFLFSEVRNFLYLLESSIPRYTKKTFFWENIRKFHFQKYKKSFFFRAGFLRKNYKKFF